MSGEKQGNRSPKNAHKPLKKHMTYNLSETVNESGEQDHHLPGTFNRTNSLVIAEEVLNEINHANLAHNHNMSYNDNMNISNITPSESSHHRPAADFVNAHMHSQIAGGEMSPGHLHRTREIENLVDLDDESCNGDEVAGGGRGDDFIQAGLDMIHGTSHLKRTHEIENLNEISKDD